MKGIIAKTCSLLAALGIVSASSDAFSLVGPGVAMHTSFGSQQGCVSRSSYGGIVNNCSYAVEVSGTLDVTQNAWHPTSVSIYGNSSWCQTVTINGVGNGAHVGAQVWTSAGPKSWQTLDLGSRYVWADMGLVFWCGLEPGGVIGNFRAY
ncbi:MAG: hypothetical protein QM784_37955 [Polyangiaceae bacterium]